MDYSISKAFSDATRSVTERLGSQIAVWGVFFAIQIGAFIVFAVMMGGSAMALAGAGAGGGADALAGLGGGMILFMIVFYLAILAIAMAAQAAQVTIASHLRPPSVGDAVNNGFRSALPLFGAIVLLLIAYLVLAFVLGMVVGLLAGASGSGTASMLVVVLICVALAYFGTKLSMIVPVIALDGERNPINAISRSWNMTNGRVLPILGTYLVFIVALVVVFGVVAAVIAMTAMGGGAMPGFGTMALIVVLYIVALVGITIYASSLTAAVHQQLSGRSAEEAGNTFS